VIALARPRSNCASKLYTHPLVREGTPQQETLNQKTKIWPWAPDGSPTPRQTGRLIVGREFNFNFNFSGREFLQFSHCELWLLESDTCGRGQFGNPGKEERPSLKSAIKQRLLKTPTDRESLVCPVLICDVCVCVCV
jgi:hypothetical protein